MSPGTIILVFASMLYLHFDVAGITAKASEYQTQPRPAIL